MKSLLFVILLAYTLTLCNAAVWGSNYYNWYGNRNWYNAHTAPRAYGSNNNYDNNNYNVVNSFGNSYGSGSVSTSGNGGSMQICDQNGCRTYNGRYTSINTHFGCRTTVCINGCNELVWNTDNCPICRCNGYSTREMCSSTAECGLPSGQCTEGACRYPPVSASLPKLCVFSHDCAETDTCNNQRCQHDYANRRHIVGETCVFAFQCPSGYECNGMTCWEGGVAHAPSSNGHGCVFDNQCPSGYSCQQMTCVYTGRQHGTSSCVFQWQCPSGQSCIQMTCQ